MEVNVIRIYTVRNKHGHNQDVAVFRNRVPAFVKLCREANLDILAYKWVRCPPVLPGWVKDFAGYKGKG